MLLTFANEDLLAFFLDNMPISLRLLKELVKITDVIVLTNQERFVGILTHRSLDWRSFSTVMHGF